MKPKILSAFLIYSVLTINGYAANNLNTSQIETSIGAKGQLDKKENVFKVSMPRDDLSVKVEGVKVTPPMGLTSWAAFKPVDKKVVIMGDLVLTENQVNPIMDIAFKNGLAVTALHNHYLWDTPRIMFMHIHGIGSEENLSEAVGKIFASIKLTTLSETPKPELDISSDQTTLDPKKIEKILGTKGTLTKGVYKVTFGRTAKMHGSTMGSTMGVNTWAAFIGSDDKAVVEGDFAVHESELQNVLKTLRKADISIVAIHQHMIDETPRIIFLHYWGIGSVEHLANAIHDALAQTSH